VLADRGDLNLIETVKPDAVSNEIMTSASTTITVA